MWLLLVPAFAELVGRIQSLHARTRQEEKFRYDTLAQGAYRSELDRVQIQMAQEGQSEDFLNSVMQQIADPIQSYMLMNELENLDKAQAAKSSYSTGSTGDNSGKGRNYNEWDPIEL
jgi:hypothetical protein